ncbi:DUF1770-domain-containing protein [Tothia fuscella]|uniref:DUF1770-domain-containing protein n=1 Tax=Tothia fuscella TaxID=1048955 RepID=A0A9P4NSN7_9PEZI|nr:DUF1770-domain-containing protein [Tothia fuscella]
MASNAAFEIASTIQAGSINRHPDPKQDINPSTAASKKQRVTIDEDELTDVGEDEVPLSALKPVPRRATLPPLPDLRFEQSYLKSIEHADGWQAVTYITARDMLVLPLVQGFGWSLVVFGWRHWNRASSLSGASLGSRIRRWWWGVNNWDVPDSKSMKQQKLAGDVKEFYTNQFASAGFD